MSDLSKIDSISLIEELACAKARESFYFFRRYIHKTQPKTGWFVKETSASVQQFYDDLIAGKRPYLVIESPPQHGKSRLIIEFIAWLAGKNPEKATIYTSFSHRLGTKANSQIQNILDSERFKRIFKTRIGVSNVVTIANRPKRNQELVEFINEKGEFLGGSFRNTTVNGSITGESLDLGVIDDPIKDRAEAGSSTIRDKTWEWFTDAFFTRFAESAGMLIILTRWHIDDVVGRLKQVPKLNLKVLSYKAIATENEQNRKEGEALFHEHKSLDFLLERKSVMSSANWEALYQQNPVILGGEVIKTDGFDYYEVLPAQLDYRAIYVDTAQKTGEHNDYSVAQCWGKKDGKIYLIDQIRGKWEAPELRRRLEAFWVKHNAYDSVMFGSLREMGVEDKVSGTGVIQDFRVSTQIPIKPIPRESRLGKYARVQDVLAYIESGRVSLPRNSDYLNDFLAECEAFRADDGHSHDDMVDVMVDAIKCMLCDNNSISVWGDIL